jgi:3-dehydroquinate synthase class II
VCVCQQVTVMLGFRDWKVISLENFLNKKSLYRTFEKLMLLAAQK